MKAKFLKKIIVPLCRFSIKVSYIDCPANHFARAMAKPIVLSVPERGELQKLSVKDEEALLCAVESAVCSLKKGCVIAVPTDTVYGIAGLAQNSEAIRRLYSIKNRNCSKPIAISVGGIDDLYRWCNVVVPRPVLQDLLPGPVTVVFQRSPALNPLLNPNTDLVGIRIPDHIFMQQLARACGSPIALTSANRSSDQSTLVLDCSGTTELLYLPFPGYVHASAEAQVSFVHELCKEMKGEFKSLWPQLDLLINGGALSDTEKARLGSTVVDLSQAGKFTIIREGSAYKKTIEILKVKYKLQEMDLPS